MGRSFRWSSRINESDPALLRDGVLGAESLDPVLAAVRRTVQDCRLIWVQHVVSR